MTEYATGSATRVLWCVAVLDSPTSSDIASKLDVSVGHASQVLKRLHESGLVTRSREITLSKGNPFQYEINNE